VDVLLDDTLRPWLLEINTSPDTSPSSPMDRRIKGSMLVDLFTMLRFQPVDKKAAHKTADEASKARAMVRPSAHRAPALAVLPPT
jgi:hypothetical protein